MAAISHCMTQDTIAAFIQHEADRGASENMLRRFKGTLRMIYDHLPEDKCITRERLLVWRKSLEDNGYASVTILNHVKHINRYLDFVDCSEIRFNKGKARDIAGMTFGYLRAVEPTGNKCRGDYVWLFQCRCEKLVELPATRVITGNTLSCGCLKGDRLKITNKYYDGTSLTSSMREQVESKSSASGYVGVAPKRDKWQAYITYKGVHYSLGSYWKLDDAVKARTRAKELVIADARGLLNFYEELEKTFPRLPSKRTESKKEFSVKKWVVNDEQNDVAMRSDNSSGYKGIYGRGGRWYARIGYKGGRYRLGTFKNIDEAVEARKAAERLLKEDPERFVKEYEK